MTRSSIAQASHASDTIIPLGTREKDHVDEGLTFMMLAWVVQGALDTDRMRSGWTSLAEIGDWRKIGARIQLNAKTKKHEWRVPQRYSSLRPVVHFTTERYRGSFLSYPEFSIPYSTPHMSIYAGFDEQEKLLISPSTPRKLSQYLYPKHDHPLLNIHVSQFDDMSVIGLAIPHVFTDALGVYELLTAWLAVLKGDVDKVPLRLGGFDGDLFADLASRAHPSPPRMQLYHVGPWVAARFSAALLWEKLRHWTCETRTLFIPTHDVQKMRDEALGELRGKYGQDIWISEGDILSAWWLKACFGLSNPKDKAPANAFYAYGPLYRHSKNSTSPFLHNSSATGALQGLTHGDIASLSLAELAFFNRNTIADQTHPTETARMLRVIQDAEKEGKAVIPVPLQHKFATMSSWVKCNFWNVDFACVGGEKTAHFSGKIAGPMLEFFCRNTMIVMGQGGGGYWIWGTLRKETWSKNPLLKGFMKSDVKPSAAP